MMHYLIGDIGHLFVITSFITSLITAFAYLKATRTNELDLKSSWLANGRVAFFIHAVAVLGICVTLFTIIANHYFEYHYAFSYSDRKLSKYYLISTFWNGQEGSFLLWMFWHAILGLILIRTNKFWEGPVMVVFALVQAFLASMILGVVIPGLDMKIGSSPFILLRDAMPDAPEFKLNAEFIPGDGNGLNPLLQNYWMVIHPPTLFLGFALTLVPFSFAMAGLWLKKYTEWVRPALPWALLSGAVLGLGILMGGYWAYETLNFGGYWNWDPVENAVYVPWLVLIAAIHTMITYKNSGVALRASFILVMWTFLFILFSTFLTRSGILGDTSVHSFTDLGLSGQLVAYLLFFVLIAKVFFIVRWKEIPTTEKEISTYSREFWVFIGALVLLLMGLQVMADTAIPVFKTIVNGVITVLNDLGGWSIEKSTRAPASDPMDFYSDFQIWFAIVIGILSAIGQFFWWKKFDRKVFFKQLLFPALASVLITLVLVDIYRIYTASYAILVFAGLFTIFANFKILFSLIKASPGLSGGAIAHIGVGMMLVGILFSAGYTKIVSLNNTGLIYNKAAGDEFNRDNLLLFVNEPRTMWGYQIVYLGERLEPRYHSGYIPKGDVRVTVNKNMMINKDVVIAKKDLVVGDQTYKKNDTIKVKGENTYYEIELSQGDKKYTLYPRAQINPGMGGLLASPDIYRTVKADLYTHVSSVMNPEEEKEWKPIEEKIVSHHEEFFPNDYVATLESIEVVKEIEGVTLEEGDVAVKATIKVKGERGDYFAEPNFLIRDQQVARFPDEIADLGLRFTLINIHPQTDQFTIGFNARQKDWVVIKAMEKPFINVLWIGTLVLMIGFSIAMVRRFREFSKMKEKGLE
jgi:cytochrome c-type biogenesis protein CcmF